MVGSAGAPGDVYMWNTALEWRSITVNAWGNTFEDQVDLMHDTSLAH